MNYRERISHLGIRRSTQPRTVHLACHNTACQNTQSSPCCMALCSRYDREHKAMCVCSTTASAAPGVGAPVRASKTEFGAVAPRPTQLPGPLRPELRRVLLHALRHTAGSELSNLATSSTDHTHTPRTWPIRQLDAAGHRPTRHAPRTQPARRAIHDRLSRYVPETSSNGRLSIPDLNRESGCVRVPRTREVQATFTRGEKRALLECAGEPDRHLRVIPVLQGPGAEVDLDARLLPPDQSRHSPSSRDAYGVRHPITYPPT